MNKQKIGKLLANSSYVISIAVVFFLLFQLFNYSSHSVELDDKTYQERIIENYQIFALPMPDEVYFAGERIPIENFDVRESLDKELLKVNYWHSELFLYLKRANRYFPVIVPILKEQGIPEDFKYVALVESGLENVGSPAGAKGVWQFMTSTAKQYGLEVNKEVDERYHLEKATYAACKYLNERYRKYKDWAVVAATYNMGAGALQKNIDYQGETSYFDLLLNPETSRYVYRAAVVKLIFEHPENYGFHFRRKDLYYPIKSHDVQVEEPIFNLVTFAKEHGTNYKILKYLNPWLRARKLTNKNGKTYILKILDEGERSRSNFEKEEVAIFPTESGDSI